MLPGSEGPGGIPSDDPQRAQILGVVALVFILFAGGLETDRKELLHKVATGTKPDIGQLIAAGPARRTACPDLFRSRSRQVRVGRSGKHAPWSGPRF
jgi:hypothetical protein